MDPKIFKDIFDAELSKHQNLMDYVKEAESEAEKFSKIIFREAEMPDLRDISDTDAKKLKEVLPGQNPPEQRKANLSPIILAALKQAGKYLGELNFQDAIKYALNDTDLFSKLVEKRAAEKKTIAQK